MQIVTFTSQEVAVNPDDILMEAEATIVFQTVAVFQVEGVIGMVARTGCPPTLLATSVGTLLIATGAGPMKRLRQTESTLSNAGVPRPKSAPVLKSTADQDGDGGSTLDEQHTEHFDYSEYGTVKSVWAGSVVQSLLRDIRSGQLSLKARLRDFHKWLPLAVPNPGELPYQVKLRLQDLFLGTVGTGLYYRFNRSWKYTQFDLAVYDESEVNGISGTGVISGYYQAYLRYVDRDGNYSDPSDYSATALLAAEPYVDYTDVEVPDDPRIVGRELWRNDAGQSNVYWLDIKTNDLTSTTFRSFKTDAQLRLSEEMVQFEGPPDGFSLTYLYGEPPFDKPFIAEYASRVWAVGSLEIAEGSVVVVNGSTTITGIGTDWTPYMAGWQIVAGGSVYLVTAVEPDTQEATIATPYQGASSPYSSYILRPYPGERQEIYFSGAGQPEAWPAANRLPLPVDGDVVTGLYRMGEALYLSKRTKTYRIAAGADPKRDAEIHLACERGCINPRLALPIGGVTLCLDRMGLYAFTGDPAVQDLSTAIADLFRDTGRWLRINFDTGHWCKAFASHWRQLCFARFHVPMGSDTDPRHAICIDYRRGRLWVEEYPIALTAATDTSAPGLMGRPLLGGDDGRLLVGDVGPLDFLEDVQDSRLTVVSAADQSVTVSTTPPADITGYPLAVVDGIGRHQRRRISSVSGTVLHVDVPWTIRPRAGSVLQVGAIGYELVTPEYETMKTEKQEPLAVVATWEPSAFPLYAYVAAKMDGLAFAANKARARHGAVTANKDTEASFRQLDLAAASGWAKLNYDRTLEYDLTRPTTIQVYVQGFSGQARPTFDEFMIVGAN